MVLSMVTHITIVLNSYSTMFGVFFSSPKSLVTLELGISDYEILYRTTF